MTYSDEEKAAQRVAYDEQLQGLKAALAAGQPGYTFPPGVYRSREKIYIEVRDETSPSEYKMSTRTSVEPSYR